MGSLVPGSGFRWWSEDKESVHLSLCRAAQFLAQRQGARRAQDWRHARLYAGQRPDLLSSFTTLGYLGANHNAQNRGNRFAFNVIECCIDTILSRIAQTDLRPVASTDGGDWESAQRGEALTLFLDGTMRASGFRDSMTEVITDALVFGTGAILTFEHNNEVRSERCFPLSIVCDDLDGVHRKPQTIYRFHTLPRDSALAAWGSDPAAKAAIERAPIFDRAATGAGSIADLIEVIEAWHLPSGPDQKDGRHAIVTESGPLLVEPWELDHHPISFYRWKNALIGFWGRGVCEALCSLQAEINRLIAFVAQSLDASAFKVFLQAGSNVKEAMINKQIGGILEYTGAPPVFYTPNTLEGTVLQWLENLYEKAFQIVGVSPMAAQGIKPAGIDSGEAIRSYADVTDSRFTVPSKRLEDFVCEVAYRHIELAKAIHDKRVANGAENTDGGPNYFEAVVPGTDGLQRISWDEVDMERSQYILQVGAESALPKTPAGRLASIQDLMRANLMMPDEGRKLLALPDLKSDQQLANAQRNLAEYQFSMMLQGRAVQPDPLQNLQVAREVITNGIALAQTKRISEARLNLLRDYLSQLDGMVQIAAANQPPPNNQMAQPAPLPVSNMLPPGAA